MTDLQGGPLLTADDLRALGLYPRSQPAYLIEGRIFDAYAPRTHRAQRIWDRLRRKVERGLAYRFVVGLFDTRVTVDELRSVLHANPIAGLREVIVIDKDRNVIHAFLGIRQ